MNNEYNITYEYSWRIAPALTSTAPIASLYIHGYERLYYAVVSARKEKKKGKKTFFSSLRFFSLLYPTLTPPCPFSHLLSPRQRLSIPFPARIWKKLARGSSNKNFRLARKEARVAYSTSLEWKVSVKTTAPAIESEARNRLYIPSFLHRRRSRDVLLLTLAFLGKSRKDAF